MDDTWGSAMVSSPNNKVVKVTVDQIGATQCTFFGDNGCSSVEVQCTFFEDNGCSSVEVVTNESHQSVIKRLRQNWVLSASSDHVGHTQMCSGLDSRAKDLRAKTTLWLCTDFG